MAAPDTLNTSKNAKKLDAGDWSDIITAVIASLSFVAGLVWVAVHYSPTIGAPPLVLAGLFGAAVGWGAGILISPYNPDEKGAFGETAKVIYGFLTGFVFSKFDPVLTKAIETGDEKQWLLACFAFITFLVSTCLTYITRKYWR
jgi:hypothetical protein